MGFILPVLTGISAALGIGSTANSLLNSGGSSSYSDWQTNPSLSLGSKPQPTAAQAGATESANRSQQALLARGQLPGIVDETSGSLTPPEYNVGASEQAGVYGSNPSTTNPGANFLDLASGAPPGDNNLPALLQQLQQMQGQGLTSGASITG